MTTPSEIQATLSRCDNLRQSQLDALIGDGVPVTALVRNALGWPSVICRDRVVFSEDGRTFEFERDVRHDGARGAYVVPCLDQDGDTIDIAAWRPPEIALWLGRVAMLGQEQVLGARLTEPLRVHADVRSWFRAGREGVFIVDYAQAAHLLRCETLGADDERHARNLRTRLTTPAPKVVVLDAAEQAA